jgi:hypothetical protein
LKAIRDILITFSATLLVWCIMTWPLPVFINSGIPASGQNLETPPYRGMIEGDHLQLMYHFWLFKDMMAGETPWFYNLYEFNTGDDRERYQPDAYYFPFSFVYSLFSWLAGDALGWNATGFISIWLTLWATWGLVRRLTGNHIISLVVAMVSLMLPYRWMSLLGGSPTGFAMLWVPVIMLGLLMAIKDGSARGGALAGFAWLFACWTDLHVFFFVSLLIPVWCLLCLLLPETQACLKRQASSVLIRRFFRGLWPTMALAMVIAAYVLLVQQQLGGSVMSSGRKLSEVALFAEPWEAFWDSSSWYYIGYLTPLLLILASFGLLLKFSGNLKNRAVVAFGFILVAGIGLILILACGPREPTGGFVFLAARKFVPHYDMIRQPAKILCLLPSLVAVVTGVGLTLLYASLRDSVHLSFRVGFSLGLAVPILALAEYSRSVNASICILDEQQGAYQAVVDDAAQRDQQPRALAIVLWPGDSHYASVYQYHAAMHRLRLVNGYSPSVKKSYADDIFRRYESMNQGDVRDEQLDDLLRRGVHYILLHENLFPAKVSPFRVAHTLHALLNHPRLSLLAQDGPVWAFCIDKKPKASGVKFADWTTWFPTRVWLADQLNRSDPEMLRQIDGKAVLTLGAGRSAWSAPVRMHHVENLRWMIRVKGSGQLLAHDDNTEGTALQQRSFQVDSQDWEWVEMQIDKISAGEEVRRLRLLSNHETLEVSSVLLTAGDWTGLSGEGSISLPAPLFFHDGYTDELTGYVQLRAADDRADIIFHGPQLPLAPGSYAIRLSLESDVKPGTEVGKLRVNALGSDPGAWSAVLARETESYQWSQTNNLPINIEFHYNRLSDMTIKHVTIERL